jgi:hypothetical protein
MPPQQQALFVSGNLVPFMRKLILFICLASCVVASGQNLSGLDKYKIDTLFLTGLEAKRVIVFTNGGLRYLISFDSFKQAALKFRKEYWRTDKQQCKKIKPFLEDCKKLLSLNDTAFMRVEDYNYLGFHFVERFITSQIDNQQVLIQASNSGQLITTVIRVTGSYIKGPLHAWAGKRYFLPGQPDWFIEITTSVS